MAITKFPLIRYKVLDRCFRATYIKYYIEDLIRECNEALYEMTGEEESVKLRQVREDIAFMRSPEGWNIELAELFDGKRRIYRYEDPTFSIMNLPLSSRLMEDFRSAAEVMSQFEGLPQFEWLQESLSKMSQEARSNSPAVISFQSNPFLKGIHNLAPVYYAAKHHTVLELEYQDFNSENSYRLIFHPWHLKQYNNRWFVLGYNPDSDLPVWNAALDRILSVAETPLPYIPNEHIDWQEYFEDIIGVTKPKEAGVQHIVIHFYGITGKYVESKPLHGSQRTRWINPETLEVRLDLIINLEFGSLILSYADTAKVIEPASFAEAFQSRLQNAIDRYK